MFKFLFFMFFLFLLLLFLMGFSVLRSFKRFFFGEDSRNGSARQHSQRTQANNRSSGSRTEEEARRSRAAQRKKIFNAVSFSTFKYSFWPSSVETFVEPVIL